MPMSAVRSGACSPTSKPKGSPTELRPRQITSYYVSPASLRVWLAAITASGGSDFRGSVVKCLFANHDLATSGCGQLIDVTHDRPARTGRAERGRERYGARVLAAHHVCGCHQR